MGQKNTDKNPACEHVTWAPVSIKMEFLNWLTAGNVKKYTPGAIIYRMDKISEYARRNNICAFQIWQYAKLEAFKRIYDCLLEDKLLRTESHNYQVFIVAGQLYLQFLGENPNERNATVPSTIVEVGKDKLVISTPAPTQNDIDPEAVIMWLKTQTDAFGSHYSVDVVRQLMSVLLSAPTKLQLPIAYQNKSIFTCQTPEELNAYWNVLRSSPNYKQVNSQESGAISRGMRRLYEYLEYLSKSRVDIEGGTCDVVKLIESKGLKYVDKRDSGGALWVIGGRELEPAISALRYSGFTFVYKPGGGKSSGYRDAWWYKLDSSGTVLPTLPIEETLDKIDQISEISDSLSEANDLKVGLFVRTKLRQLSKSGFTFSDQQLRDICDWQWGKLTFRLATPHPFAIIVDGTQSVSNLAKDERGNNRYWNEVFSFGDVDLIICSQWYERNREYFNEWFSALGSDVTSEYDTINEESVTDSNKYEPLKRWLFENGNESIRASFSRISDLVGGLPPSAYKHRAFWSNTDSHPCSVAWMGAGYKVVDCNLQTLNVRFDKSGSRAGATSTRLTTVKASLIDFSNKYKGQIKTRREIVEELSAKYGHNEYSVLPADYEIGLNNSLPKLFRRIDHGTYECLGYNLAQSSSGAVASIYTSISDHEKEKTINVIVTRFKNGLRKSSSIDFERFKNFYVDEYEEDFKYDSDWFNYLLSTEALVYDDRAYIYSDEVVDSVRLYLEQMDSPCIFIDTFFEKLSGELYALSIFSADMLRAFIEKNYPDISVKWDYILLQENVSPSDLIKGVFSERETWSFDELQGRLPCLKMDTIRQTMNSAEYFRVDKGTYTHIDNMDLPDSEGDKVRSFVESKLWERDYVTANELDLSKFVDLNPHCSFAAIRDAVFYKFLSNRYDKSGQVITRAGGKLRVLDIMEQYCREADSVSFEELNAFEATFDPEGRTHSQCLIAGHNTMVRVSAELFVSDNQVDFDVSRIDEAISLYCHDNFIPLRGVTDFSLFPFAGFSWNLFLLESYVRRFSRVFKYDVRAVNSANIGAIVRKSFDYSDYDDVLAYALAKSPLHLSDKNAVANYLFDNGYIGWRNLGKSESKIIMSSKALREEGTV